jgi:hypothetical protein
VAWCRQHHHCQLKPLSFAVNIETDGALISNVTVHHHFFHAVIYLFIWVVSTRNQLAQLKTGMILEVCQGGRM